MMTRTKSEAIGFFHEIVICVAAEAMATDDGVSGGVLSRKTPPPPPPPPDGGGVVVGGRESVAIETMFESPERLSFESFDFIAK